MNKTLRQQFSSRFASFIFHVAIGGLAVLSNFVVSTATSAAWQDGEQETRAPNIVLIVADDLGWGEVGCYGQKLIATPHIDKIANNGFKFTSFYSAQAVCAPSRCSLLTGMHQGHAYIRGNGNPKERGKAKPKEMYFPGQHPIPDEVVTLPELLKTRGYATAAIGKWGLGHFGTSGDPNKQGVDLFYGFNCQVHAHNHYPRFLWRNNEKELLEGNDRTLHGETYSQDKFTEVALQFIDENKDQPFFLYLPFAIPHLSIQVPDDSLAQFRGEIVEEEYEHRGYLPYPEPRAGYAAMVSHMDRDIGKVMQKLQDHGLTEETLVIFTSDNGPTYDRLGGSDSVYFESAGPFKGRKGQLTEGGIRVPMVVQWPGKISSGQTTDHISAFWDILPTVCEAAGVEPPAGIDGISFLPTLTGGEQKQHDHLYWEFSSYSGQQAVRMGDWKAYRRTLIKNPDMPFELYDLSTDPGEANNVADSNPDVIEKIKAICKQEHTNSELFPFPALDKTP